MFGKYFELIQPLFHIRENENVGSGLFCKEISVKLENMDHLGICSCAAQCLSKVYSKE